MADCVVFTDCYVELDGNDISADCHSVELPISADEIDCSAFGSAWKAVKAGPTSAQVTIEAKQKYGAGNLEALLWSAFGTGTASLVIRPTSAATAAGNPGFSATFAVTEVNPISGRWGEKLTTRWSWPSDGTVTRATA